MRRRRARVDEPRIVGVVGAIGAGKSAVSAELAQLGALVADSDAAAREALDTPEALREVTQWWGPGVVTPEGRADRARIAALVFEDPPRRARLEALIHPMVKGRREAVIALARSTGAPMVVVDAPLLFEAGVEAECDAVVFVDAPREIRERRVRESRGWTPQELARREAAQWPAERKRSLSDIVIVNDGTLEDLRATVREVFQRLIGATPGGCDANRQGPTPEGG